VSYKMDINTLEKLKIKSLKLNEIGRVVLTSTKALAFDSYRKNKQTGSFILIDPITHNTCAVGMILDTMDSKNLSARISDQDLQKIRKGKSLVPEAAYIEKYKQKGETIWITGLHGSGKNELAFSLEKRLFELGAIAILLDGSSVRFGLSRELDFTPADRAENLRRVAHICKMLNDQGILCICSFMSRNDSLRNQVAEIIGKQRFHLIYMDTDLDYCRQQRPELYDLFDQGKTDNLPGLDLKYEVPQAPKMVFQPEALDSNIEEALKYLDSKKIFPLKKRSPPLQKTN